jgi:hypothetical protein
MPAPLVAAAAGGGAAAGGATGGGLAGGGAAAGGGGIGRLLGGSARGGSFKTLLTDMGIDMGMQKLSSTLNDSSSPSPSESSGSPLPLSTPSSPDNPGGHNWGNLGRAACFLGGCGGK